MSQTSSFVKNQPSTGTAKLPAPGCFPQFVFCAGDELPDYMEGSIKIQTKACEDCYANGDTLPDDFVGAVLVDFFTCKPVYLANVQPVDQEVFFKASTADKPVVLPSFDGYVDVYTSTETVRLYGGDQTPEGMVGAVICDKGDLCYIGHPPMPEIPDEVQIGGSQPAADSEVEIWVNNGIPKVKNADGFWVQLTNYGA